ncbi:MAG: formate/nitrite transporter family protein [Clostridiales Family XIII bacterium]|nr:formate/nitrite transporter family protein [Clostridiales Family XIII bacterium]
MGSIKQGIEIVEASIAAAKAKASSGAVKLTILGILAGAFIALAAHASNMAGFNLLASADTYGLGRAVAGAIFPVGLMLVVIAGAELFTGNTLMAGAVIKREISFGAMLRNWGIVYAANLCGSLLIVAMIDASGLLHAGGELLGGVTIKIAAGKTALSFGNAFVLGILCNWLVCLAVWMAFAATGMTGKLFAIFFPIWLFVTSGFEHSVANMYYIPAGIIAKANDAYVQAAQSIGVTDAALGGLTWQGFFVGNLVPVTMGNIVGGSLLVSVAYLVAYGVKSKP